MLARHALNRPLRLQNLLLILIAVSAIYVLTRGTYRVPLYGPSSPRHVTLEGQVDASLSSDQTGLTTSGDTVERLNNDTRSQTLQSQTVLTQPTPASLRPEFHVVIAHYEEDPYFIRTWLDDLRQIPYIQELGLYITIYTKGTASNAGAIQEATGADSVIVLPNVGREGGSYLRYILEQYDDPPLFTLFTQAYLKLAQNDTAGPAEGHLRDWLHTRLRERFDKHTGFMSLDRKHDICYCGHCTDMGRDDFYPLWSQLYALITGEVCQRHEGHILSFNGHFIVSRKRVLARPRRVYEYLAELVDASGDHWVHTEPEPKWFEEKKGQSVPSNPKFGHTLERLWHTLFACDRPEQVTDCQVVGMRAEGPGGCSCRD